MTVVDSGKRDPILGIIYILIGGFRRFFALLLGIKKNLDHNLICPDMLVDAVEVIRGPNQTEEEFQQDLLIRSIAENEQRLNFTTNEKLEIVKRCKASKIPTPRAASALSMSESQFARLSAIVEHDWLQGYVTNNCIGATDAAVLIQLATKKGCVEDLRKHLDTWVATHQAMIDAEEKELRKIKKRLSGSASHVKKFATPKLMRALGRLFGTRPPSRQQCRPHIRHPHRSRKGTIEIPATTLRIADLSSENFATVIGELQEKADECIPLLCQRRMLEQSMQLSPEDVERERERIRQQRRQEQEDRARAEAGQPAPDFNAVEKPQLRSINEAIGDDNENLDDDVDEPAIVDADEPEADVDADADN